jgi:prepilin-type N-terminal cleavage/methylation domain-containing protein
MSCLKRFAVEEGFSLLELLMVAAIIGILVSIAVVSFAVSVSASKKTVCKANLRIIEEQTLVYRSKYDENPPALTDLVPEFIKDEKSLHCPESGEEYDYNPATGEVSCPYHTDL